MNAQWYDILLAAGLEPIDFYKAANPLIDRAIAPTIAGRAVSALGRAPTMAAPAMRAGMKQQKLVGSGNSLLSSRPPAPATPAMPANQQVPATHRSARETLKAQKMDGMMPSAPVRSAPPARPAPAPMSLRETLKAQKMGDPVTPLRSRPARPAQSPPPMMPPSPATPAAPITPAGPVAPNASAPKTLRETLKTNKMVGGPAPAPIGSRVTRETLKNQKMQGVPTGTPAQPIGARSA